MSAMARKKNSIVECTILQIDLENTRLQEGNKQTKKKIVVQIDSAGSNLQDMVQRSHIWSTAL